MPLHSGVIEQQTVCLGVGDVIDLESDSLAPTGTPGRSFFFIHLPKIDSGVDGLRLHISGIYEEQKGKSDETAAEATNIQPPRQQQNYAESYVAPVSSVV